MGIPFEAASKTVIPKGLVHKEEDEKKLKAEFEEDPHGFMMKAFGFERPDSTKEEGTEFEKKDADNVAALKEETWG